jgi:hypothetical protein
MPGCSKTTVAPGGSTDLPKDGDTDELRAHFLGLQRVLKEGDTETLWSMLSSSSQADADRNAKSIQASHSKADDSEKAEQEKTLGLSRSELASLTGKGYLKTKLFQHKYHEVPDSKLDHIEVEGDNATVHYVEEDGDKEKLIFVREGGIWRAWLKMPRAG